MAILITAASYSAAFKIDRMLGSPSVYFGEQLEMPPIPGKKFIRLPDIASFSYINEMLKICLDNQISIIFPLKRTEILALSTARQLFEEYGISLNIPSDSCIQNSLKEWTNSGTELLILSDGQVIAGVIPEDLTLIKNEKSGIFSRELINGQLKYQLFGVNDVEI